MKDERLLRYQKYAEEIKYLTEDVEENALKGVQQSDLLDIIRECHELSKEVLLQDALLADL